MPKYPPGTKVTVDADEFALGQWCRTLLVGMQDCAKDAAKKHPSPKGKYAVFVLMDGDGNLFADAAGDLVICNMPILFDGMQSGLDGELSPKFKHPEQLLSRSEVAELLTVSTDTVDRATVKGELPAVQISPRRVGHRMEDVLKLYVKRRVG